MSDVRGRTARRLADEVAHRRKTDPVGNALLALPLEADTVANALRRLVAVEFRTHAAELVAYGTMLSHFPRRPAADLYLTLGRVVCNAGPRLEGVARSMGMDVARLRRWPAERGAHPFNCAMTWAAMAGGQAAGALAAHSDMITYYTDCCALVDRLRAIDADATDEFIAYYDDPVDDVLCALALDVVQDGLDHGDDPEEAILHARRVEEAIGEVWRAVAHPEPNRPLAGTPLALPTRAVPS
ncbi:hypothetical protein ACFRCG_10415 [Embleya sp. NPDC056575]|uniref:hypothetical protein n=1 Tax=unclassified Embleya TaxID=2699296 RepID=UPI0036B056A5